MATITTNTTPPSNRTVRSEEQLYDLPGTQTATGIALIVLALAILGGAIYYYVHQTDGHRAPDAMVSAHSDMTSGATAEAPAAPSTARTGND